MGQHRLSAMNNKFMIMIITLSLHCLSGVNISAKYEIVNYSVLKCLLQIIDI